MQPILDKIQSQLKNGRTLAQHKYHYSFSRDLQPDFVKDLYPFASDYYHELNPYYLINIVRPFYVDFSETITVRDGQITFAAFMAQHSQFLKSWKAHFFIHPSLSQFIPNQYLEKFQGWRIQQNKKFDLKKCHHLLIAGIANENCIGSLEELENKLKVLNDLPRNAQIEVLLPIRRNPLVDKWEDNYLPYEITVLLKKYAKDRQIHFIKVKDIFEKNSFNDVYLLELFSENFLLCDSYLSHFIVSKGGISNRFTSEDENEILFELDLSFYHKLQIINLPRVPSFFNELVFYKKLNPHNNYYQDPGFKALIEKQNFNFLPKA